MAEATITVGNVRAGAGSQVTTLIAGVDLTQGQPVYADTSNLVQLADADGASATQAPTGITVNAASAGQPVSYVTSGSAVVPGFTASVGDVLYLSPTPGRVTTAFADVASGDRVVILGVFTSTTVLNLVILLGGTKA